MAGVRAAIAALAGMLAAVLPTGRAAAAAADTVPRTAIIAEALPEAGRLALIWAVPTAARLAQQGDLVRLLANRPVEIDPAAVSTLVPWLLDLAAGSPPEALRLRLRAGVRAVLTQPRPRLTLIELVREPLPVTLVPTAPAEITPAAGPPHPIPVPVSRPTLPEAAPVLPAVSATAEPPGTPPAASLPAPPDKLAVTVSAQPTATGLELRFRWDRPVPAAMFVRADRLWVVFSGAEADVAGWRSLGRPEVAAWLAPLGTQAMDGARAFRFQLRRPAQIDAAADGAGWRLRLSPADTPPPAHAGRGLTRSPVAAALEAVVEGDVARLRDPDSGERLGALLTVAPGASQPSPMRLVDLELLPSIQGYAWRALADDLTARVEHGRLTITRPGGLRLSAAAAAPPPAATAAPTQVEAPAAPPATAEHPKEAATEPAVPAAPLGLAALEAGDAPSRQEARQRILGEIGALPSLPRALARLELARLYLADALGPEARTALDLVDIGSLAGPVAGRVEASRTAMTGAAEALTGRSDRALAALLDHRLDADPEVALWRAFAAAGADRWQLAAQEWLRSDGLLDHYPTPLRRRLGLEMAAGMLDHGDAGEARSLLARLQTLPLAGADRARLQLLDGIARLGDGHHAEAAADLAAAAAGGDADVATRAAFLLVDAQAKDGSLRPDAAADRLAAQRAGWRGHLWESRMLRRLAELQTLAGRPAEAIASWRQAVARAGNPADATAATAALQKHLRGLLAAAEPPVLPPVARLALHRAYGSALVDTPDGPAIGAGLAEAAASTGLIETASALLDGYPADAAQPPRRRAELALAAAQAAAGDYAGAAGRAERLAVATPDPAATGMAAEWRAHAALGRAEPEAALAALGQAATPEATRLRLAALAGQGAWPALAQAAEAAASTSTAAEAAVWLGLARRELGQSADATVASHLAEGPATAMLRLAAAAPAAVAGRDQLPAAIKSFAAEVGATLRQLPPLGGGGEADAVRTAGARSAPAG